ncbi:hypothetical protein SDC9_155593 [bioreactor metagenome]|uniref:Uncharacterized protein n=1 Tax=bioreactor metagenome TaxID=1076179 RepID=A0A645F205_9ZZZZ
MQYDVGQSGETDYPFFDSAADRQSASAVLPDRRHGDRQPDARHLRHGGDRCERRAELPDFRLLLRADQRLHGRHRATVRRGGLRGRPAFDGDFRPAGDRGDRGRNAGRIAAGGVDARLHADAGGYF